MSTAFIHKTYRFGETSHLDMHTTFQLAHGSYTKIIPGDDEKRDLALHTALYS